MTTQTVPSLVMLKTFLQTWNTSATIVGVAVQVLTGVAVNVPDTPTVAVGVNVGVNVTVLVAVLVEVFVLMGVFVGVLVTVLVGVKVGVLVKVFVLIGV